jgi:hypothetical protein
VIEIVGSRTCPGLNCAMHAPGTILGFAFATRGVAAEDGEAASTARKTVELALLRSITPFC